ncbi:unnamed protein product, partial [Phaeothamnion confervicola]
RGQRGPRQLALPAAESKGGQEQRSGVRGAVRKESCRDCSDVSGLISPLEIHVFFAVVDGGAAGGSQERRFHHLRHRCRRRRWWHSVICLNCRRSDRCHLNRSSLVQFDHCSLGPPFIAALPLPAFHPSWAE